MEKTKSKRLSRAVKVEAQKEFEEIIPGLSAKEPEPLDKPNIVRKTTEKAIVERAANFSVERIVRDIAELQLNLGKTLTELSAKLTAEATKLAEIEQAITIEDARLHEIHEIDTAVVSLKGLLEYQGERKGCSNRRWMKNVKHLKGRWSGRGSCGERSSRITSKF